MNIPELLKNSDKTLFTFELIPPLKGGDLDSVNNAIEPLLDFAPSFINVTYHREEIVYKKREKGLLEKKIVRKRPGTVGISAAIKFKYGIEVVPHIICGGFNQEETENALIDLYFLGIHNVLALRGDTPKNEKYFVAEPDGHQYASGLVKQIMNMNKGIYLDDELENTFPTNFSVGVAAYPEKHIECPNFETDLHYLKQKVNAGADYIVTQMFFDNNKFFRFVDSCRKVGINVPIIPGLKPISTKNQVSTLPQTFNIDIPQQLVLEIEKCKDNSHAKQIGIEWTIAQCKELIKHKVPVLHFFTMGKSDNIQKVLKNIF